MTYAEAAARLLPATDDGVGTVAKFFRALGDSTRLRLLEFLLPGEHTVSECVAHVGLSQGRVSVHLACLAECGYVEVRRAGRKAFYRVADPRVAALVTLARELAADNCAGLGACGRVDGRDQPAASESLTVTWPVRQRLRQEHRSEEICMEQRPDLRLDKRDGAAALTPPTRRAHHALLAAFAATGRAPLRAQLEQTARELKVDPADALAELAERDLVVFDADGEVRAAYPFSPTPTPHRVSWEGGGGHAMCAIDALGMSAMLGTPVTITAEEPGAGELITVEVDGDRATWRPDTAVVLVGSTDDECCPAADRTCGYINFFTDERRAQDWAAEHPDLSGKLLDQSHALAHGIAEFGEFMSETAPAAPERAAPGAAS